MRLRLIDSWKLRRIGNALSRSDPALASWLATFTRLANGAAMPAHEQFGAAADGGHTPAFGALAHITGSQQCQPSR